MSGAAGDGKGAGDPAMDDILASIRRILNEDEGAPATAPATPPATPPAGPPPATDVAELEPLVLTEDMLVAQPSASLPVAPSPVPPLPDPPKPVPPLPVPPLPIGAETPLPALSAPEPEPAPQPDPGPSASFGDLVAPAVAAATTAALGHLLRAVAAERSAPVHRGGPSIEDVVREELRPLLKSWLDQHLPPLVERLVRTEIERVVGRAPP